VNVLSTLLGYLAKIKSNPLISLTNLKIIAPSGAEEVCLFSFIYLMTLAVHRES
jgi:hypothetical protein